MEAKWTLTMHRRSKQWVRGGGEQLVGELLKLTHQGQGYEMKDHIKTPTVNSQHVLSFYSVRSYWDIEMFEPMIGPRVFRLGTGITKGKDPREHSILRPW